MRTLLILAALTLGFVFADFAMAQGSHPQECREESVPVNVHQQGRSNTADGAALGAPPDVRLDNPPPQQPRQVQRCSKADDSLRELNADHLLKFLLIILASRANNPG